MKAKIIDQSHVVSKVVTDFSVNGKRRKRIEYNVHRKTRQTPESRVADHVVFDAINKVGWKWADVTNYIDKNYHEKFLAGDLLERAIDKHTIL